MNIFKVNDIIIKTDNYEHQIEHFRLGSIYKKLSRPISAVNHLLPPPTICKMGLVCRHDSSTIFIVPRVYKGCATLLHGMKGCKLYMRVSCVKGKVYGV
jgi:hypothetical protein